MATRKFEGKRYNKTQVGITEDLLSVEEALQININLSPFTITMRTPGDDKNLVWGLLHSEGVLNDVNVLPEIKLSQEEGSIVTVADLFVPEEQLGPGYMSSRSLMSVSSCGMCGKTEFEILSSSDTKLVTDHQLDVEILQELFQIMNSLQSNFQRSGGTHAAVAFTSEGHLLSSMEDIGRHNAVDKVVGELIRTQVLNKAECLIVSGRISYEIVLKCYKASIPFLAAVSAPSTMAVDYAQELGITLFAFCRDQRATCYSNMHRVKKAKQIMKMT